MPEPHLRAADADRAAVASQLGEHMAAGRLTVFEYEERLGRAYAARTYGELDELTADLPAPRPVEPAPSPAPAPVPDSGIAGAGHWDGWAGRHTRQAAWASWAGTAVIVLTIWLVTSFAAGELLYPWPVWVIGPWGAILLAQSITAGRDGDGKRRQLP
ncbi:DUF1707 SHOCT-like domain-containing protein [Geodermatophilus ruber]|uniref:DUF1707 domain-containing protein n=1 Tax=Geodermatophilus ruber TaxID=504800 RepID=A0A1I4J9M4_9ACTN|nr:DUF1707 domain-containing protein [Geodermatophilus ruber]SFL63285.1 protein of unknown function [Geodermatophilus ruber]